MKYIEPGDKHYRVVHSIYPPKNVFDTVSDADSYLIAELAGATSDRLQRWRESVDINDARFGEGWGPVMASFCYVRAGRFNTDDYGCYYSGDSVHTALKEWSFHAAKVWNDFNYSDTSHAVVRCYTGKINQPLVDVTANTRVHARETYEHSQKLGMKLFGQKEFGVYYRSVRHSEGHCFGLYRPPATTKVHQTGHYTVLWDGDRFSQYAKINRFVSL